MHDLPAFVGSSMDPAARRRAEIALAQLVADQRHEPMPQHHKPHTKAEKRRLKGDRR